MSGFNAGFVRIPVNTDPEAFAEMIAGQFFSWPQVRSCCRVQYAHGFDWLHLCGFSNEGDKLTETCIHPALRPLNAETISLTAHAGSSSYFYRHHIKDICLRAIFRTEDRVAQNFGDEEPWEKVRREELIAAYGPEIGWPARFDADDVIKGFGLPSPWSNGHPEVWDLDLSWEA